MDADYLVIFIVLMCCFVNRQSLIFLCAFSVTEIPFLIDVSQFYSDCFMASMFAYLVFYCRKYPVALQASMAYYATTFFCAAIDYVLFPQIDNFYVIFPYVIKIIDIYVIYHLIKLEGQNIGAVSSTPYSSFYKRLHGL